MDISVLIPVYNEEKYIKKCIESILNQQFNGTFEVIIVDDGSIDSTKNIIRSFNDERIKLIENNHSGIVDALNTGLEHCTGKYIARMDGDDVMFPNRLKIQFNFMETNSNVDLCCGGIMENSIWQKKLKINKDSYYITHEMLKSKCCINHPTVMFKNSLNIKYDKNFDFCEDYALWLELSKKGHIFYYINKPMTMMNKHKESITKSKHSLNRELANNLKKIYNE